MLNPRYHAAVVAGNVEVSQAVTNALYGALGVLSASQGTMNNFTFGNETYQYYETICGGSGAGPGFDGADGVHTHMTNSRLTDPEVHPRHMGFYRRCLGLVPMTAAILSNNRRIRPYGLAGGGDALPGGARVERADGGIEVLSATAKAEMGAEDVFVIETPGGSGYGKAGDDN